MIYSLKKSQLLFKIELISLFLILPNFPFFSLWPPLSIDVDPTPDCYPVAHVTMCRFREG